MRGGAYLAGRLPSRNLKNFYYYYYATQVLYNMGGKEWDTWNGAMRDHMIGLQDDGSTPDQEHQEGSWSPKGDELEKPGGRLMCTSLALLCLEIYYRYLPLNRKKEMGLITGNR